jgi:hypothetical protein
VKNSDQTNIFDGIMPISSIINEQFNGAIWRMEIDKLSDTLFVEIRNNDDKQVSFSAIDLKTGDVNFKGFTTPERWLTGIETAYNGVFLIHNYQSETGPVHKGLVAIDAKTAQILWSNYNYAFDHLSASGPVIYDLRIQPRKLFLVDVKTGATTRFDPSSVYQEMQNNIVVPELTDAALSLLQNMSTQPFGNMVYYLDYNKLRIVSLHALYENKLTQSLYIMDGDVKIYEDLLNIDIQKIQPEAFIMHKNRLIYIKNKSNLRVLSL